MAIFCGKPNCGLNRGKPRCADCDELRAQALWSEGHGIFDCTPAIAAKLARCEAMAREQRRRPGDDQFNPYYTVALTVRDFLIIADQLPRFNLDDANR